MRLYKGLLRLSRSPQLCQNVGLSVLSSIGETEKSRRGGGDSYVVFGQEFLGAKESVIRCVVVMQRPVLLLSKFREKSSQIIKQSPSKVRVACGIDCWPARTNSLGTILLMQKES
jgi:hypothetical protein